jgi:hypothetical protein
VCIIKYGTVLVPHPYHPTPFTLPFMRYTPDSSSTVTQFYRSVVGRSKLFSEFLCVRSDSSSIDRDVAVVVQDVAVDHGERDIVTVGGEDKV